jgi:hypothetical protein
MTASNESSKQAAIYTNNEERMYFLDRILTDEDLQIRIDTLAGTLITLSEGLDEYGPQGVRLELERLIGLLFERSEVRNQVFQMYRHRHYMRGTETLEDTVAGLFERTLAPEDEPEIDPEAAKERIDAVGAIYNSDRARVLIVSRLLSVDDDTLNAVLHLLNAEQKHDQSDGEARP